MQEGREIEPAHQHGGGGRFQGIPQGTSRTVVLSFTASESLMRMEAPDEEQAAPTRDADVRVRMRRRFFAASGSGNEEILATYTNNADGTFTETRKFMGRTFRIRESRTTYEWRLVAEQSEFLGYMVQKATVARDSTTIEAWFTPEIPSSAGPGPYNGLPGLILVVSVNRGEELYSATAVDLSGLEEDAIVQPEEGEEVTREEYERMVDEKLRELRATRRRIR